LPLGDFDNFGKWKAEAHSLNKMLYNEKKKGVSFQGNCMILKILNLFMSEN